MYVNKFLLPTSGTTNFTYPHTSHIQQTTPTSSLQCMWIMTLWCSMLEVTYSWMSIARKMSNIKTVNA